MGTMLETVGAVHTHTHTHTHNTVLNKRKVKAFSNESAYLRSDVFASSVMVSGGVTGNFIDYIEDS